MSQNLSFAIPVNMLKAVALAQGKNAVRYLLNGVLFEVAGNKVKLVATDGTRAHIGDIGETSDMQDTQVIIPANVLKQALTGYKQNTIDIRFDGTRHTLGAIEFTPIDGRFPDYRRIIPEIKSVELLYNNAYNYEFMADLAKAAKFLGCKNNGVIVHSADAIGIAKLTCTETFLAVIMPLRDKVKGSADSLDVSRWK